MASTYCRLKYLYTSFDPLHVLLVLQILKEEIANMHGMSLVTRPSKPPQDDDFSTRRLPSNKG